MFHFIEATSWQENPSNLNVVFRKVKRPLLRKTLFGTQLFTARIQSRLGKTPRVQLNDGVELKDGVLQ